MQLRKQVPRSTQQLARLLLVAEAESLRLITKYRSIGIWVRQEASYYVEGSKKLLPSFTCRPQPLNLHLPLYIKSLQKSYSTALSITEEGTPYLLQYTSTSVFILLVEGSPRFVKPWTGEGFEMLGNVVAMT
jgi:hypothetical protein